MKTFLTIFTAVLIAVGISTLLTRLHENKPKVDYDKLACEAGAIDPACKPASAVVNSVPCGLDTNEHIVPDGKGGCISPPPSGYILDVPQPAASDGITFDKYPVKRATSVEELERVCPWNGLVTQACEDLFALPKNLSCVGKPFKTCIGGERVKR